LPSETTISESNVVWELKEQEHVDAVMRGLQSPSEETQIERFPPLSVRVGVAWLVGFLAMLYLWKRTEDLKDAAVAKVIEFYIPTKFSR
jgi:hypothetical protein